MSPNRKQQTKIFLSDLTRDDIRWEYRSKKVRERDGTRGEGADLPPVYIDHETLISGRLQGFQSMYGVHKTQAALNIKRGNTKKLYCEVWCDTLLVDFDNKPNESLAFKKYLDSNGYAYIHSDSGNRSDHYHVPITPLFGIHVPYSVSRWLERYAPGHDPSFPQSRNGMFRLLGTRHEKTGYYKTVLSAVKGRILEIPYIEEPDEYSFGRLGGMDQIKSAEAALMHVLSVITVEPTEGRRHQFGLWSPVDSVLNCVVKDPNSGEQKPLKHLISDPIRFAEGLLYLINGSWEHHKPVADLERILDDVRNRQ